MWNDRAWSAKTESLIGDFCNGDIDVFTRVWDEYVIDITNYVSSHTKSYDEQQDLIQNIRIALYNSRSRFNTSGDLGRWIYGICKKCCLHWQRSNVRTHRRTLRFHRESGIPVVSDYELAENEHELRQQCDRAVQSLDILTARQREVLERRFFLKQSVSHVAEALHCTTGTVKATSHVALNHLRKKLETQN